MKKTKTNQSGVKKAIPKDIRFSVSLVILIGMLTFSSLLLLFSLNNSVAGNLAEKASNVIPISKVSTAKKAKTQILDDELLNYKITIPAQLGEWFYKIGEVKSLTDDSLSNQYLRVFVPLPGTKSINFDHQNTSILTIRKFSADEWSDIEKSCRKEKSDICEAAGELISAGDEWVYTYVKPKDCPKSVEAKCGLIDKIIESFQMK